MSRKANVRILYLFPGSYVFKGRELAVGDIIEANVHEAQHGGEYIFLGLKCAETGVVGAVKIRREYQYVDGCDKMFEIISPLEALAHGLD